MKTTLKNFPATFPRLAGARLFALATALALCGCDKEAGLNSSATANAPASTSPLAVALAPHSGSGALDAAIRQCQERVRSGPGVEAAIERLGWLFVAKARETFDPGFYTLAERCALALEERCPGGPEALLLRGHVLQSQHRFKEGEAIAMRLVAQRGLAFDFGLLGDILVDLGRVDAAAGAYQSMLDLKPDPQGFARAAHIRWLKGDLEGALELMRKAAGSASPRDPELAAWMQSQLARYLWQGSQTDQAVQALHVALKFQTNYAPALLLRGRIEMAAGHDDAALPWLRQAAEANPLPEYWWALSEALHAVNRSPEARVIEARIEAQGAASDARGSALFFATTGRDLARAVSLARQELAERADVFTHDALAWALAAAGAWEEAQCHMECALAEGTQDARLFFHATVIFARAGNLDAANAWIAKAERLASQLLPSEKEHLQAATEILLATQQRPAASGLEPALGSNPDPLVANVCRKLSETLNAQRPTSNGKPQTNQANHERKKKTDDE